MAADEPAVFAEEQGLFFSEASALSGDNIERAFLTLLQEIHANVSRKTLEAAPDEATGAAADVLALKGTKLSLADEISIMETSALRRASSCSCT